jgi:CspA family cold shock protein
VPLGQPIVPAEFLGSFELLRAWHFHTRLFLPNCDQFPELPPGAVPLESRRIHCLRTLGDFAMRQSGTIKFYNAQKGYGFIKPDDGGKDVFVHVTAVERAGINNLDEGARLSFETEPDKRGKGPKAINLQAS